MNNVSNLKQMEYGIDVPTRSIFLEENIDLYTGNFLKQRILMLNQLTEVGETTVYLASPGGNAYGMLAVVDLLKSTQEKINVVGSGAIMSAAVVIIAAANGTRSAYKNTMFMVHAVTARSSERQDVNELEADAKHVKVLNELYFACLEENSKKPKDFWKRSCKNKDFYFTADQALEFGIIDKVI